MAVVLAFQFIRPRVFSRSAEVGRVEPHPDGVGRLARGAAGLRDRQRLGQGLTLGTTHAHQRADAGSGGWR